MASYPGWANVPPRDLTSATDARTTRFRRTLQRRSSCAFADRSRENPPCDPVSRATLPRPPHPVPNVRDDSRSAPLAGQDGIICKSDLGRSRSDLFFARGLDRNFGKLPVGQITRRKKCRKRLRRSAFLSRPTLRGRGIRRASSRHERQRCAGPSNVDRSWFRSAHTGYSRCPVIARR